MTDNLVQFCSICGQPLVYPLRCRPATEAGGRFLPATCGNITRSLKDGSYSLAQSGMVGGVSSPLPPPDGPSLPGADMELVAWGGGQRGQSSAPSLPVSEDRSLEVRVAELEERLSFLTKAVPAIYAKKVDVAVLREVLQDFLRAIQRGGLES